MFHQYQHPVHIKRKATNKPRPSCRTAMGFLQTFAATGLILLLHQAHAFVVATPFALETATGPDRKSKLSNMIASAQGRACTRAIGWHPLRQKPCEASSVSALQAVSPSNGWLLLRGGEISALATGAYDWCMDLNSPSALVAGAVIATIYENIGSGALDIDAEHDTNWVQFGKRVTRLLLLSAFAFEVLSIFVTTVTGTMLLSHTEASLDALMPSKMVNKDTTPLKFLNDNFEFEYLTARITFLQGILNWLGAIALGHILPSGESTDSRVMNQFIGSSLMLLMVIMLAFYNSHMNFYTNYFCMLSRWLHVCWGKFVWTWPPRPNIVFSVPILFKTLQLGFLAFTRGHTDCESSDEGENNAKQDDRKQGPTSKLISEKSR